MNKTWINSGKGEDKIISIDETNIYKSNPKILEIDHVIDDVAAKWLADQTVTFTIPFNIIREIRLGR